MRRSLPLTLVLALSLFMLTMPQPSQAGWVAPRRGSVVKKLPAGHRPVWVAGSRYFVHGGRFYRPSGRGFVVVRPPIGVVVASLPIGFSMILSGGVEYYHFEDVYYRRVPEGYVVVEAPPVTEEMAAKRVMVIASRLYIRSAPGLERAIVRQVKRGDVLEVLERAGAWLRVRLPDGDTGWVKEAYTEPLPPGASG